MPEKKIRDVGASQFRNSAGIALGISSAEDCVVAITYGNVRKGGVVPLEAAEILEEFYEVAHPGFEVRERLERTCSEVKAQGDALGKQLDASRIIYLTFNGTPTGAWVSNQALRDLAHSRPKWWEQQLVDKYPTT